jgi:RNA:NAD 2'-phosphotransferase (TPT1/KptA family)
MNRQRIHVTTQAIKKNMGLSVVVFMKTAPTAEQKRLHGATNQFWQLRQQTGDVRSGRG